MKIHFFSFIFSSKQFERPFCHLCTLNYLFGDQSSFTGCLILFLGRNFFCSFHLFGLYFSRCFWNHSFVSFCHFWNAIIIQVPISDLAHDERMEEFFFVESQTDQTNCTIDFHRFHMTTLRLHFFWINSKTSFQFFCK